jgi:hypothetical protein
MPDIFPKLIGELKAKSVPRKERNRKESQYSWKI